MVIISADIADTLTCSKLAAEEIIKEVKALSRCYVTIYDTYALDHIIAAKRAVTLASFKPSKKKFSGGYSAERRAQHEEQVRLNRRKFSRAALRLFDHAKAAYQTTERLRTAVRLANIQSFHRDEEIISLVLAALHADHQLSHPEKVSDGRLAYESMRRDNQLLKQAGVVPEVY